MSWMLLFGVALGLAMDAFAASVAISQPFGRWRFRTARTADTSQ
jgi:hypothetical protein